MSISCTSCHGSGGSIYVHDTTSLSVIFNSRSYDKGAWVVHQLRHVLGDTAFFTALGDYRPVSRDRHVAMLRAAVDGLFTAEYLSARGLTAGEAVAHNDSVAQALDVCLTRYEQFHCWSYDFHVAAEVKKVAKVDKKAEKPAVM